VLSTDAVVHDLYSDSAVRDAVVERFGSEVAPNGEIDRDALARRAFADPEQRAWLEGLVWPRVGERVAAWRREVMERTPPPRAAVVEVPLLFEAGLEGLYDATIAIVADEGLRGERAEARGHAALQERASRQLAQAEKAARATFAVSNDGTVAELEEKLSAVLESLNR
jgi:dephospho-CoA kinase